MPPLAACSVLIAALVATLPVPAPGQTPSSPEPVRLTLEGVLHRVKTDSPVVEVARAKLADYEALFDRAYFAWLPQLRVDAVLAPLPERRLLRQCVLGDTFLDPDTGAMLPRVGPCPGQDLDDDEQLTADTEIGILVRTNARLTFPIYTFGKVSAGQEAARAGIAVGRAGIDAARAELESLVKKAWYGALLADAALEVLEDGRKRMAKAKRDIEKELEAETGRFTSNDLRKLIVDEADIESLFLETRSLRRVAREGLRIAAGLAPGVEFEQADASLEPVRMEPRDEAELVELAARARPELQMAEAAVAARSAQVDMAVADMYPDIALVGLFAFAEGTSAEDNPDPFANDPYNRLSWGVVLGAEWKFDPAAQLSKVDQAEAALRRQKAERAALLQRVRLDIAEEHATVQRYADELAVRQRATKAAKGWLVSNSLNFGLGLVTTDQLLSSLVAYAKAGLKQDQIVYEYNLAVTRLSRTVGVDLALPAAEAPRE